MAETEGNHTPIRQSVRVDCPIEEAFRLFTQGFGEWWPGASDSAAGDEAEYRAIEPWVGGRVYERTRSGEECEWGAVTAWDPPRRVAFTWHPGTSREVDQSVDVEFSVEADGTRVTLIHSGWHLSGVEACASHAGPAARWPDLLAVCFSKFVSEQMLAAV